MGGLILSPSFPKGGNMKSEYEKGIEYGRKEGKKECMVMILDLHEKIKNTLGSD